MPVRPRKPWTVLIYMVADDPQGGELLDSQAVTEMDHIVKATLSVDGQKELEEKRLYVALQVDFRSLPGVWRRLIGGGTFVRPESNAADPATLYGFFEWADGSGVNFGIDRLCDSVLASCRAEPDRIVDRLRVDLEKFHGGTRQADDTTALVIRCVA